MLARSAIVGCEYGRKYKQMTVTFCVGQEQHIQVINTGNAPDDYETALLAASIFSKTVLNSSSIDHFVFDVKGYSWSEEGMLIQDNV